MIKPLYFPNIYVNYELSEALKGHFDKICVYGVTAQSLQNNYETIIPAYDDDDEFNEFLLTGFDSKPLYDPNRAFQLMAELQKRVEDATIEDASVAENDRLMKARVFLQMAHEYDIQSKDIHQELQACKKKELDLLNKLHGFDGEDGRRHQQTANEVSSYSSDFQVEKRFESWATIFEKALKEQGKVGSGFYITDISALIENIIEFEPELEFICEVPIGIEKEGHLSAFAERLINCDWDSEKDKLKRTDFSGNDSEGGKILFYILPEKEPFDLFKKFTIGKNSNKKSIEQIKSVRNTVLGYIVI